MTVENKIKLTAISNEDIKIFSYLCQDAIISKNEMLFDKKENMFLATLSRYCWEKLEDNKLKEKDVNYRVISGLRIINVTDVKYINFSKILEMEFLSFECGTANCKGLGVGKSHNLVIRVSNFDSD